MVYLTHLDVLVDRLNRFESRQLSSERLDKLLILFALVELIQRLLKSIYVHFKTL